MRWKGFYTNSLRAIKAVPVIVLLVLIGGCKKSNSAHDIHPATIDDDYLTIVSHAPIHNDIQFADSSVWIAFCHDIDMSTVNASTFFVLNERSLLVSGTYHYIQGAKTVRFVPTGGFEWGGRYTAHVTTGIYNTKGLHMKQGYSWSFSIAPFFDTQKPRIDASTIQPTGNSVHKNTVISFRIIDNGHIDCSRIPSGVMMHDASGGRVEYMYAYSAELKEIRCTPLRTLMEGQSYTVSVTDALSDEAGNPLENPHSWQFTVQAVAPQVVSVHPAGGQTNVSIGEHIRVVFSEPLLESTVRQGMLIEDSNGNVSGALHYDAATYTVTFIPDHLAFYTDYTVTITTAIKDTSGIPLDQDYVGTFRTMQENIQPEIARITPGSPIGVTAVFQIVFSEPMDADSLHGNIVLRDSYGNDIPVRIDYDDAIYLCTIAPEEFLIGFYDYVLAITTGITDIHGNPLIRQYAYNYTTQPAPVSTVVLVYMPGDYAGGDYIANDIGEMITASGSINPAVVRIVGLADYPYGGNTQLFESIYGKRRTIALSTAGFAHNELNTAHKDTIDKVLQFIDSRYQPQKKIFIVLDRKPRSVWSAAEDAASGSFLTLHDFTEAIKNRNIPVLVLDAPMKSTVEVADELRSSTTGIEYLIASQGDVLAGGFDYTALLNNVYAQLSQQPPPYNASLAIAESICSSTAYPVSAGKRDTRSLALIDLLSMQTAVNDMSFIVSECEALFSMNPFVIDTARFAAPFYYPMPWYADWVRFLQATGTAALHDTADRFSASVLKRVSPPASSHSGLSIMFPTKTHEQWYRTGNPYSMDFISNYQWDEFLHGKHIGMLADDHEPGNDAENGFTAMGIDSSDISKQLVYANYIHDPYDTDIYTIDVSTHAGVIYEITTSGQRILNNENKKWQALSCSDDGTIIAAAEQSGYISTSLNGGAVWIEQTGSGSRNWSDVALSANGAVMAACVYGGFIYTSTDYGTSWTARVSAGSRSWQSITCSANGVKLAAAVYGGYLYTSADGGSAWVQRETHRSWIGIAGSEDGVRLIAAAHNGHVYISSDSGTQWNQLTAMGIRKWAGVACSADGRVMAAAVSDGNIWISADGGAVWTEKEIPLVTGWKAVTISDSGREMAAAAGNGMYVSDDYGQSWFLRHYNNHQAWSDAWYAGSGTKLLASVRSLLTAATNGTLSIHVGNVPENCEIALGVIDHNGTIVLDSNTMRNGPGGEIVHSMLINSNRYMQYHLYIVPVSIAGWSMNTQQRYTVQLQYIRND